MLLDSNIIIYLRDPNFASEIVRQFGDTPLYVCNVVLAEVLGYGGLTEEEATYFEQLFAGCKNLLFDERVTAETIQIRRQFSIGLPDAIIAGTALAHTMPLWSRNESDFQMIPGLKLFNPID